MPWHHQGGSPLSRWTLWKIYISPKSRRTRSWDTSARCREAMKRVHERLLGLMTSLVCWDSSRLASLPSHPDLSLCWSLGPQPVESGSRSSCLPGLSSSPDISSCWRLAGAPLRCICTSFKVHSYLPRVRFQLALQTPAAFRVSLSNPAEQLHIRLNSTQIELDRLWNLCRCTAFFLTWVPSFHLQEVKLLYKNALSMMSN